MISIAKRLRPCGLLAIALLAGRIAAFSSTDAHFFDRCPSPESRRVGGGHLGHRGHHRRRTRRRTTWPLESTRTTPQPHDAATASIDDDGISSQSTIPRGGDAEEDGSDAHDFETAAATAGSGGTVGSTGSTAIVLNMNARSVTPALISIASDIVGPDNVFVTCSAEDAVLAARTVVRGRIDRPALVTAAAEGNEGNCGEDIIIIPRRRRYSLVIPVGGDGTLSGWVNTMIDEILLFHKLEHEQQQQQQQREENRTASWKTGTNNNNNNETNITTTIQNDDDDEYAPMSVEEAMDHMPHLGYIPMGTGNGLGYVIGCKEVGEGGPSLLSRANIFGRKRRKAIRAGSAMAKLKGVGDAIQEAREEMHQLDDKSDVSDAISAKCSIVEMPLMEVTHPPEVGTTTNDNNDNAPRAAVTEKGDLCFFAGAGFDSLMLHDFQTIKSWSKSSRRRKTPHFVRDALSSVMGYCVALVARTLPRTVRYGTHNIRVEVTTEDEGTLWVDHRRGDFSELAIAAAARRRRGGEEGDDDDDEKLTTTQQAKKKKKNRHLIYSGSTGIIAASTTPYYGGGLRLFPYARLFPERLQLRLGRISPLTGFLNIPKIFEGSYREKSARDFGCLDFVGTEFEVEVSSGRYDEYVRKRMSKKKKKGERKGGRSKRWLWLRRRRSKGDDSDELSPSKAMSRGFPFQHSGESMGTKERFKVRVVREPVKFVSFLEPRVIVDD